MYHIATYNLSAWEKAPYIPCKKIEHSGGTLHEQPWENLETAGALLQAEKLDLQGFQVTSCLSKVDFSKT